ncbi:MAG TPA: hypothetical protein VLB45_06905 [Nitrosopumilaceae archaeon]|nr:hypothetical protein [Nitrosopumilaceae archaeon]
MTKLIIVAMLTLVLFIPTSLAFAASGGTPSGQPFQELDQRISALEESDSEADSFFDVFFDVFTDVDSFFDVFTELQESIANLQSNIDAEAAARAAADTTLQSNIDAEAAARAAADSTLQSRIFQNCPTGQSIRQINVDGTVVCEFDDIGAGGGVGRLIVREVRDLTPGILPGGGAITDSFAACDTGNGEIPVGGGYAATSTLVNVWREHTAFTAEGFGWLVTASLPTGITPHEITAIVYCAKVVP